jgi:rare lipoprotein A
MPHRESAYLLRLVPACAAAAVLLAACGSPPVRPPVSAGAGDAPPPHPAPAEKPATAPRPGGYYLDDGPGADPPPDLDAIADADPRVEPLHRFANNPYSVFGEDYVPNRKLGPYRKRGLASWYGRRFHGQKTASGERYDMYAMTAAHPTLPIPSYARVTNVGNGRSVVVRINDRGPFHPGRIIDLSYTAAHKLGYTQKGSTLVDVQSIAPEEIRLAAKGGKGAAAGRTPAAPARPEDKPATKTAPAPALVAVALDSSPRPAPPDGDDPLAEFLAAEEAQASPAALPTVLDLRGIFLQLGVFSSKDGAESFRDHVRRELSWLAETLHVQPRDGRFRLHLGPYRTAQEARRVADRIREALDVKPLLVQR